MADEQDRWLDRETAEILLRGESLEAVDPAVRERAERLVQALGALASPPVPTSGELPGEAAALAAFRKVRAERADEAAGAPAGRGRAGAVPPSDAALIRIGPRGEGARRPRRDRPLRLGLAAALTVGMVGGVAVAAGTGVLPRPFDDAAPDPAATVSAAESPDRPLISPSPLDGMRGGSVPGGGPTTGVPDRDEPADGTAEGRDTDSEDQGTGGPGGGRQALAAACRDVRAGRELDDARRRALEEAAGSSSKIGKYCRNLLAGPGTAAQDRDTGRDAGSNGEAGEAAREREPRKDAGNKGDKEGKGDKSDRGDDGGNDGKGAKGGKGGGGGGGDGDGKGDDGGGHIVPPAGQHHRPHAPSAPAHRPWSG
ncbi:hypothetical protein ACFFKE_20275 [Streptomyces mutabilis]|uniref:hypothetical protein n=1 Tax=Streptomyces mutabilis TaxID=67332 RepID=UPI00177EDC7E|nr:hypothetical protein [Streptomyces mutabilis]GGQ05397.1 hypothetical protein GCM10010279_10670 [Streptomyces mutabilis]